jgi:hypothetical protein
MKPTRLSAFAVLAAVLAASSGADAAELIVNGGFEDGTYTVNGDDAIPVGWTPNDAVTTFPGFDFDHLAGAPFEHSGQFALQIGNFDGQPLPIFTQTFADTSGVTYTGTFYVNARFPNRDPNAFLKVSIDGATEVTVTDALDTYTQETFSFTGTGSDTIAVAAQNTASEFYIDDISVTGSAVAAVPEPATWAMMLVGFGGLGAAMRRRRSDAPLGAQA